MMSYQFHWWCDCCHEIFSHNTPCIRLISIYLRIINKYAKASIRRLHWELASFLLVFRQRIPIHQNISQSQRAAAFRRKRQLQCKYPPCMEYKLVALVNIFDWITYWWIYNCDKLVYSSLEQQPTYALWQPPLPLPQLTLARKSQSHTAHNFHTAKNYRKAISNKPTSIGLLLVLLGFYRGRHHHHSCIWSSSNKPNKS